MRQTIESQRLFHCPYSFCMDAAKRYFRKVGVTATPMHAWLQHGRLPDEFDLLMEPCVDGVCATMRGRLRLEPLMPGGHLEFTGSYEFPDAVLGNAIEQFMAARLLRDSLDEFLDELVRAMELQFEQFCADVEMTSALHHA